jgi:hypothetical protein
MKEERIVLPDFLIADLYKNHLIEPERLKKNEVSLPLSTKKKDVSRNDSNKLLNYLGENKKNVIVLVAEPTVPFIKDDDLSFLTKILKACSLTLADIAIINTHNNLISFDKLTSELKAQYILLLNVEPASIKLPFNMPHFQVQQFSKCTIISAPSLSSMVIETPESIALKRQLWVSLQEAFGLK